MGGFRASHMGLDQDPPLCGIALNFFFCRIRMQILCYKVQRWTMVPRYTA
jgi:hypothetical protein